MTNVIKLDKISKSYQLYSKPSDRLKQLLFGSARRKFYSDFWALKDISFEVNKGEAVGIIGENGAGKSTLLEIIAGTLTPTDGSCEVNGKISALLELGSGFNPEFTGRENIYMGASILGFKQKEIAGKYQEIVDFADIGKEFLDRPVKTYSSGMMMRLAFAVSTCMDPDILIVDEALSVGDAIFQAKCYSRIRKMMANGTSLLFVSHSIDTVRSLCSKALWINHGKSVLWDDSRAVCKEYEKFCWKKQGIEMETNKFGIDSEKVELSPEVLKPLHADTEDGLDERGIPKALFLPNPSLDKMAANFGRYGTGELKIRNFLLTDIHGNPKESFGYNEPIMAWGLLEASVDIDSDYILGLIVKDLKGQIMFQLQDTAKMNHICLASSSYVVCMLKFNSILSHGVYTLRVGLGGYKNGVAFESGVYRPTALIVWDVFENAVNFKVEPCNLFAIGGPVALTGDLKTYVL